MDKYKLELKRCNDYLKTRNGLKSLIGIKMCVTALAKGEDISVESAIATFHNGWLYSFSPNHFVINALTPSKPTQTI